MAAKLIIIGRALFNQNGSSSEVSPQTVSSINTFHAD
jgi:hypothetical protein